MKKYHVFQLLGMGSVGVVLLMSCMAQTHQGRQPISCDQITTRSYETGVITTNLTLSIQPTVNEVIRCFGKPAAYQLTNLPILRTQFTMLYPSRGLAYGYTSGEGKDTTINAELLLTTVIIRTPSTTITDMVHSVYVVAAEKVLAELRPWPEKFDSLHLDR